MHAKLERGGGKRRSVTPLVPLYKSMLKKVVERGRTEKYHPLICSHSCDHLKPEAHFYAVSTHGGSMLVEYVGNSVEKGIDFHAL